MVKNLPANAGDAGSIPGSGRSPGGGHGNPLQCSCLENPVDRVAWQATVHGVAKSWTWLSDWAHKWRLFWIAWVAPVWSQGPLRGSPEDQRQEKRCSDQTKAPSGWSDALRREEGARSQEAQVPLETGEGTEADSPLQPPEEAQPSQHQGFSVLASRTGREEICVCVLFLSHWVCGHLFEQQ